MLKKYLYSVKKILKTYLSSKNKITTINQRTIKINQAAFGIINWPQDALDSIDIKTRKLQTIYKLFYKIQNHARLYLPRSKGAMGLINISNANKATTISTSKYIESSSKTNFKEIKTHEKISPKQHQY